MPQSIQEALSKFNLDSQTTTYAVCPLVIVLISRGLTRVPSFLFTTRSAAIDQRLNQTCMQPLLRKSNDTGSPKPIKPFVYHHFHDFVGNLLSRPDLEEAMDKACDDLKRDLSNPSPEFVSIYGRQNS